MTSTHGVQAKANDAKDVRVLPPAQMEEYTRLLFQRTNYIEMAAEQMNYRDQGSVDFDDAELQTDFKALPTLVFLRTCACSRACSFIAEFMCDAL
jgi:hypothetical protein